MCSAYRDPVWWDNDSDREGNLLRADVRNAAKEIWPAASRLTNSLLGDATDAAEVMEVCVTRVSRYLDSREYAPFSQKTNALLMVAFRNELLSRAARRRRVESIEDDELSEPADPRSLDAVDFRIDLEKLVRRLSKRARTILVLRGAGYEWNEIASQLKTTVPAVKNSFQREVREIRGQFAKTDRKRPACEVPRKECKADRLPAECVGKESKAV